MPETSALTLVLILAIGASALLVIALVASNRVLAKQLQLMERDRERFEAAIAAKRLGERQPMAVSALAVELAELRANLSQLRQAADLRDATPADAGEASEGMARALIARARRALPETPTR